MSDGIIYQAADTCAAFHESESFVRGIRGPLGSGKSSACCLEIYRQGCIQDARNGVRKSRWGVIRNTYGELKNTTIAEMSEWFGDYISFVYGHPITGLLTPPCPHGDGSRIEVEIVGIAMDKPKDIKRLKSLQLSSAWLNEASEIPEEALSMITARVGRYPPKRSGGASFPCIIMDTNSCDMDNWWYRFSEETKPDGYQFFDQPAALLRASGGVYSENPDAENIDFLPGGYEYYFRQIAGKPREWVDVFILNQFGTSVPGNYIYSDYLQSDSGNHAQREFDPGIGHIIWAHDFNFTPLSSVICQESDGEIFCVDEIVLKSAVAKHTAIEFCKRYADYKNCLVKVYGDASGHVGQKHGIDSDYRIIEKILRESGFRVRMCVPRANPAIKSRQMAVQAKILDAENTRSLFVNPGKCRYMDRGLGTVKLKGGSTFQEEDSEYQHITTALGYYVAQEFPIRKLKSRRRGV